MDQILLFRGFCDLEPGFGFFSLSFETIFLKPAGNWLDTRHLRENNTLF